MTRLLALAVAIAACLLTPAAALGAEPQDSRTAFWRLGETSGTLADDSEGSNDGTYAGGYTLGQPGATSDGDKAVDLDGTSGRITTSYNPFQNGQTRTFEGWAYRDTSTGYHTLVGSTSTTRSPLLYLPTNNTDVVWYSDAGVSTQVRWTANAPTGQWFHWAFVFDEAADRAELFINGVSLGSKPATVPYNSAPGNLVLGAYGSGSNAFNGRLDDVAVYDRALRADEVGLLYAPTVATARTSLWRLDETSGTLADDAAGANDGTYTGGYTLNQSGATALSKAVGLDGTSGRITTSYNPFQNGSTRTFEGWAYRDGTSGYHTLVGSSSTTRAPLLYLPTGSTDIVWYSDAGVSTQVRWTANAPTGQWFHWAFVFDEVRDRAELYVNGVSLGQRTAAVPYNSAPGNLVIGAYASANAFKGRLDDVAVYSRALSPTEIEQLYVPPLAAARIAFWRLDDSGPTAVDSRGSNNGTYAGGATQQQPGATRDGDTAVDLDGSDDRVTTSFNPFQNGQTRSFEGWAYRDSTSGYHTLLGGTSTTHKPLLYLPVNNTDIVWYSDAGVPSQVRWTANAPTGSWFHWVFVFDEAANEAELFVNGVSLGRKAATVPYNAAPGNLVIGAYGSGSNAFDGRLDDVAVYDRALGAGEVAELYAPDIRALRIAFWRLNETTGTQARDSKGSYHGTYTNGYLLGQPGATPDGDKAVELNASGTPGYVDVPFVRDPSGAFSIEAWVKRDGAGDQTIVAQRNGTGTGRSLLYVYGATGTFASNLGGAVRDSGFAPQAGRYYHVVFTYAGGADGAWRFYVDGTRTASGTATGETATGGWVLGANKTFGAPWDGMLDDVAVYPRALRDDEVSDLLGPAPANLTPPKVSGDTHEGSTLTAEPGSWSNHPTSFTYRWQRCSDSSSPCTDIAGATSSTYTLTAADAGSLIRVVVAGVSARGAGADAASQRVGPVIPRAPEAVVAPAISGTPEAGQILTADRGTWTGSPVAYRYRWLRCDDGGDGCVPIAGATAATYVLTAADVGSTIRVEVEAENAGGTDVARSQATAVVEGPKPHNTTPPTITGDAVANSVLTAQDGGWSNDPTTFRYQWQRCDGSGCSDVAGATARTYLVRTGDVGLRLRVTVTASNAWGEESAVSAETQPATEADMSSAYVQAVQADLPQHYFRFEDATTVDLHNETGGPTGQRAGGTGINPGSIDNAIDLHNSSAGFAALNNASIGVHTTIEFWLKTTSSGNIVNNRNEGRGGGLAMVVDPSGVLAISEADTHWSSSSCAATCAPVNDGAWHHIAYVQDAAANETRWYVDGVETNRVPYVLSPSPHGYGWSGNTYLGWDQYAWRGTIPVGIEAAVDEFAIYDHPLTAENVAGHFSSRVRPVPPTNRTAARVVGDAREGDTLTAAEGQWWDRPTSYAYRWQRCDGSGCTDIAGAGERDYTPTAADVGSRLRVIVTASNAWGDGSSASAHTIPVLEADNGAAYANAVGGDPPAHWYRFEGPSTFDLHDETGGATGARASATTITRGPVDNGLDLHNSSAGFARLDGAAIGVDTTIEFWLKTTSTGNIVNNRNETYGGGLAMVVDGSGALSISETDTHAGSSSCGGSCPPVNDGAWHHVAYVQDLSANETRWYVDGTLTNQVAGVLSPSSAGYGWSGNTYLGFDYYGYRGTIPTGIEASVDEFAIHDGPLSAAAVAEHFAAAH